MYYLLSSMAGDAKQNPFTDEEEETLSDWDDVLQTNAENM